MLGIVLVAHNDFAQSIKSVAEHVAGPLPEIQCVSVKNSDDIELKRQEIAQKIALADKGKGVVVLTDMFGGTPSNLAISLIDGNHIEVVSGMNVPMLVKLIRLRRKSLEDAITQATESGRQYILIASKLLEKKS